MRILADPHKGGAAARTRDVADHDSAAAWDAFLVASPRGQFQQTSGWARVKAAEGWSAVREYLDPLDPGRGGFQLLWKRSRLVRIGYVTKGPVLVHETEAAVDEALTRVLQLARRLRLTALVLQPPDDSLMGSAVLVRHGFFPEPLGSVIRATGMFSLEGGVEGVIGRMSRKARRDWRSARRLGVTAEWGARDDIAQFFELMCESARRQQQMPNPARVDLLEALWDAFPGNVSLAFAVHAGRRFAGVLTVVHGDRIVIWKKGWNSERPDLFASAFVLTECLIHATTMGYAVADIVSMAPALAEKRLTGHALSDDERRSRDIAHLRLGAQPKLLPPAHLAVVPPLLKRTVYSGLKWPSLRTALDRRIR